MDYSLLVCSHSLAHLVKYWEHKVKHQLIFGLVLMVVSFVIVAIAGDFKMFVAAMVILTLGEVFFTPVIPMIANKLAPKGKEGFYQGLVNSASTIGRMIGPLFGGMMVDHYGMQVLAIVIVGILIIAIIPCLLYDSPLKTSQSSNKHLCFSFVSIKINAILGMTMKRNSKSWSLKES